MNSVIAHTRETANAVARVTRNGSSLWIDLPLGADAEVTVFVTPAIARRLSAQLAAEAERAEFILAAEAAAAATK